MKIKNLRNLTLETKGFKLSPYEEIKMSKKDWEKLLSENKTVCNLIVMCYISAEDEKESTK